MRAVIFTNGTMERWPEGLELSPAGDLLIAADGGAGHCLARDLTPDVVVGDLDSLSRDDLAALEGRGVEIIRHRSRKDETDLELALMVALERQAGEIIILGALGLRWDMTLSNLLVLTSPLLEGVPVTIMDGRDEIICLRGPGEARIQGRPGDRLSLIPLGAEASGVTLKGLEYPLKAAVIPTGGTRGVSNVFRGKTADVSISEGLMLVVVTRK